MKNVMSSTASGRISSSVSSVKPFELIGHVGLDIYATFAAGQALLATTQFIFTDYKTDLIRSKIISGEQSTFRQFSCTSACTGEHPTKALHMVVTSDYFDSLVISNPIQKS